MQANQNQIILYQPSETISLEVRLENETVWLTQEQIAQLFGVKRPAITKHIRNIYEIGELDENSVCSILERTASDGKIYLTQFYNLDMILSVGYRVNSKNAVLFRKWSSSVLKDYLLNGYALNNRLSTLDLDKYHTQYPLVNVHVNKNCHDRFLIVDDTVYHIGASIKDLGQKLCAVMKMNTITAEDIINIVK